MVSLVDSLKCCIYILTLLLLLREPRIFSHGIQDPSKYIRRNKDDGLMVPSNNYALTSCQGNPELQTPISALLSHRNVLPVP